MDPTVLINETLFGEDCSPIIQELKKYPLKEVKCWECETNLLHYLETNGIDHIHKISNNTSPYSLTFNCECCYKYHIYSGPKLLDLQVFKSDSKNNLDLAGSAYCYGKRSIQYWTEFKSIKPYKSINIFERQLSISKFLELTLFI